jgi:hypothetical protein
MWSENSLDSSCLALGFPRFHTASSYGLRNIERTKGYISNVLYQNYERAKLHAQVNTTKVRKHESNMLIGAHIVDCESSLAGANASSWETLGDRKTYKASIHTNTNDVTNYMAYNAIVYDNIQHLLLVSCICFKSPKQRYFSAESWTTGVR